MTAVNFLHEMDTGTFYLIASRPPECGTSHHVQIFIDGTIIQYAHFQACRVNMMPDACVVTKYDNGGDQTVRLTL